MPDLPKTMQEAWERAVETPGELIPVGRIVVCDDCGKDYTDLPDTGGVIVQSKAICQLCAVTWLKVIAKHHEEEHIKAICPEGEIFADFVRDYRVRRNHLIMLEEAKP